MILIYSDGERYWLDAILIYQPFTEREIK